MHSEMGMMFLKLLALAFIVFEHRHLAPHGWRAIGAEAGCIEREREALLRIKVALGDVRWSSWGAKHQNGDCCQWEGVACNNQTGHIIKLHLPGKRYQFPLKGEMDASLTELQYLMYLNISNNQFFGDSSIPEFLGNLRHLRYLDLHNCRLNGNIPAQLGLLSHLQYLDLSGNWAQGTIPPQLGNLSQLQYLDLSNNYFLRGAIPHHLGGLSQLRHLDLSRNRFTGAIPHQFGNLSQLQYLQLSNNYDLEGVIPRYFGNLSQLRHLDLSINRLTGAIPRQLGNLSQLQYLDLSRNSLTGIIPQHFRNLSSLQKLFLDRSGTIKIYGTGHEWLSGLTSLTHLKLGNITDLKYCHKCLQMIANLPNLKELQLPQNDLSDKYILYLSSLKFNSSSSLSKLDFSVNNFKSSAVLDWILNITTNLVDLRLSRNLLNWTIPKDFPLPSSLVYLDIHSNFLKGIITNSHLANLHNLKSLDLSDNSLTLRFSHDWVPPFQLEAINVRSCKLGPGFPKWLQNQNNFTELDISNAEISGTIPEWFWGLLTPKLIYLNVSSNNISGTIPDVATQFTEYPVISLASNQFEGSLPRFLLNANALFLSNNNFSELHQFLCANGSTQQLIILDLSNNQFFGQLPNCWSHFRWLSIADLSDNKFSGELPASIGSLQNLQALVLRNNEFSGDLFITLKNCSILALLDAGGNRVSGISSWIGIQLDELKILILRNNNISGSLLARLCSLSNLHFLDLSFNNLSGQIPQCFQNFTPMALKSSEYHDTEQDRYEIFDGIEPIFFRYDVTALLMWKGTERIFEHQLLLKGIDLSSNKLVGKIPPELGMLVDMKSLNLSRNQLNGEVSSEIGWLASLDSLDLSRNHLSGPIPSSFAQIDRLAVLDLSHNNLSGKIPTSTQLQSFNVSSYEGNLGLCGKPLEIKCPEDEQGQHQESVNFQENNDSIISRGYYWSMAFGFIFGFWGTFGPVLFNRTWRHMYLKLLDNLANALYVFVVLNATKCNSWIRGYML